MAPAISIASWTLPDRYYGRGRRNEGAVCLCNDGACPLGEVFLDGARKPDISTDPVLSLDSEVLGDKHLLTTNHHRDAASDNPNRPLARTDGIFSVSSFLPSKLEGKRPGLVEFWQIRAGGVVRLGPRFSLEN